MVTRQTANLWLVDLQNWQIANWMIQGLVNSQSMSLTETFMFFGMILVANVVMQRAVVDKMSDVTV